MFLCEDMEVKCCKLLVFRSKERQGAVKEIELKIKKKNTCFITLESRKGEGI